MVHRPTSRCVDSTGVYSPRHRELGRQYTSRGRGCHHDRISPANHESTDSHVNSDGGSLYIGDIQRQHHHFRRHHRYRRHHRRHTGRGTVRLLRAATVTLAITEAWLIHPSQPTLSVSIDAATWRDTGLNVDPASSQQNTAEAAVTLHQPVGRTRTVAIATGNRLDETWPLVLLAPHLADRDDVRAIVRDQTPLLLRSPASFNWDLTDGWYSIQGVQFDRLTPNLTSPYRRITLPLIPSDPPVVRVATDRTWHDVLEQNDTWADVLLRYDTYTDVLSGFPDARRVTQTFETRSTSPTPKPPSSPAPYHSDKRSSCNNSGRRLVIR